MYTFQDSCQNDHQNDTFFKMATKMTNFPRWPPDCQLQLDNCIHCLDTCLFLNRFVAQFYYIFSFLLSYFPHISNPSIQTFVPFIVGSVQEPHAESDIWICATLFQ